MTNFIPIFPLGIVVYPGEQLNLHIFEPRYKQLISECFVNKKPFGLPPVINNRIAEMGTMMQVTEITKTYDDGKMDIKTVGLQIFKILELLEHIPGKLYNGAIVTYPAITIDGSASLMKKVLEGIRDIHKTLSITKDFKKPDEELNSYDVAHHAGLSMEDEYHLLELEHELHRQEFLKRHLAKVQPIMAEMDILKGKIKMNGHFKNLTGLK
ncbi:MAG: LON peptidase substrate-binding domain-containing protein [Ferruginibacter sp.]